ncbi:MAG: hypothetical protein MUP97_06290 [Acidimicrobiia bacterium]|jgi:hypothetical protein|nr:hypothetical protein [Acidimicrobiia bacterium]
MRRAAIPLACLLVLATVLTAASARAAPRRPKRVNECTLLTTGQAGTIMGAEPYARGAPDGEACSWQTDPTDRANLRYVVVTVEGLAKYLGKHPDVRTFLDESTTVGIDPLPGVGSEAYSTYSALSGPGSSDGITVRVGKQVLSVGFQATDRVENPSPEFDQIVAIVQKMAAKLRRS